MKKIIIILVVTVLIFGCEETADRKQAKKTEQFMQEANKQIGMPAIVNFQEKKLMKQVYELRDQEKLICHAYLFNKFTGEIGQYLGECIGFGIPYSTQFSNPERRFGTGGYNLPQPEPNGLFMPEGLSATWLLLLDKDGNAHPVYIEPEIIVSPFKLH